MREKPWEFVEKALFDARAHEDMRRILVVTGIGGCGKTQLILKFLRVHANRFISSFFIDGSSESRIRADIIRNVRSLGTLYSQMGFDECLRFLSQPYPGGISVIFYDNVDDPDIDILSFLPDGVGDGCTIIITSRNRSIGSISPESHLELDKMTMDEAIKLILHGIGHSGPTSEQERNDAENIAKALDCLPIALQQARSYMRETRCSASSYLERLLASRDRLLSQPVKYQLGMRYLSTYAAFEASYERLEQRAQQMLQFLSCFHWSRFPLEAITEAAKFNFSDYELEYNDHGEEYHVARAILRDLFLRDGQWNILDLDKLMISLQTYSLITLTPGADTKLLEIHPVLHQWPSYY
ncbi:hypothetical protein M408DRAFT_29178 [Serendipita vermifera MAFF 305830]|uniref:Uncharacterized protein n=1 Tax=Serendipita vermifera MAFF 305830 TaxID=933852 RepID=A0A0C3AB29_SERVB|nr:hypothetical protein M408DRAFT_29178 [Serendipita vermifera MAFF 305830]